MVMILTKTRENKGADSITCRTELVSFEKSSFKTYLLLRALLSCYNTSVFQGQIFRWFISLISTKLH